MNAKHTPGPWQVIDTDSSTVDVRCARGLLVAEVGDTSLEDAANASLIAAAPDLLDALRRVMRHIPSDAGGASLSDDLHRARKVIAKATAA